MAGSRVFDVEALETRLTAHLTRRMIEGITRFTTLKRLAGE